MAAATAVPLTTLLGTVVARRVIVVASLARTRAAHRPEPEPAQTPELQPRPLPERPSAVEGQPPNEPTAAPQEPASPDQARPRASELVVAALMVSLLAGLVFWGSTAIESEQAVTLGPVDPAKALDAAEVPSGAFITVSGHPDPARLTPLYAMGPGREQGVLLVLREAPRLVLHCRHDHAIAALVRRRRPPTHGAAPATPALDLDKLWAFSGRIFDAGKYSDPQVSASGTSVQQFVQDKLAASGDEAVRVLAVGVTPAELRRSARTALFFAVGMTIVAIVLWTLAIHSIAQDRRERTPSERTSEVSHREG